MISNAGIVTEDTIVAIATAMSPAHRGAIRFSGDGVLEVLQRLGIESKSNAPHQADVVVELGPPLGAIEVRALIWPTRRSYTGQPSAELHTIGCLPVLNALLERAIECGARMARPGEFTLRAFLAGRLDLTQAEAVLGVIDAEQRGSLDHALRQLGGNLSRPLEGLRSELIDLLADVEAGLDFVDEDIEFISEAKLMGRLQHIRESIAATRVQLAGREESRSRFVVALRGMPNAGKSRLLNALVGKDVAIVAGVAGTTRDVVSAQLERSGVTLLLVDTAGIEEVGTGETDLERITRQAQQQSQQAGHEADVRLWCVDWSCEDAAETARQMCALASEKRRSAIDLWVATKSDQYGSLLPDSAMSMWHQTSAAEGSGIESLRSKIVTAVKSMDQTESISVVGTAARCTGSLVAAEQAIESAVGLVQRGEGQEFVASEIRVAVGALGEVTGTVYTDDLLDRVFSRFCIGK